MNVVKNLYLRLIGMRKKLLRYALYTVITIVIVYGIKKFNCAFRMGEFGDEMATMEESKELGVFLNEYRVIPNEFYIAGKKVIIYNAWTERAWNKVNPCDDTLVYFHNRYHFNIEMTENWDSDSSMYNKFRRNYSFESVGAGQLQTSNGRIFRERTKEYPKDTIVIDVFSVRPNFREHGPTLMKIYFIKKQ